MADYTLTYKDSVNPQARGWTSFWSFVPDGLVSLRNKLFSFKDGQLYLHHSESVNRNNFYGVDNPSTIQFMVNQAPSEVKVLKAVSQEGTEAWDTTVKAFESDQDEYRETVIDKGLYQEREGMWYTHPRRAESTGTTEGSRPYYGIGVSTAVLDPNITIGGLSRLPNSLMVGDEVYNEAGDLLGTVANRSVVSGSVVIEVDDTSVGDFSLLTNGEFIYGKKDLRIDGSEMRGYVFRVDLESNATSKVELYGFNAEVFKSHK